MAATAHTRQQAIATARRSEDGAPWRANWSALAAAARAIAARPTADPPSSPLRPATVGAGVSGGRWRLERSTPGHACAGAHRSNAERWETATDRAWRSATAAAAAVAAGDREDESMVVVEVEVGGGGRG